MVIGEENELTRVLEGCNVLLEERDILPVKKRSDFRVTSLSLFAKGVRARRERAGG